MDPVDYLNDIKERRSLAVRDAFARGESTLQRFYSGRTAFVTGGTGFLGKNLIEKLLRDCKISKLFVLIRPKKGIAIEDRLQDLVNDAVFDVLREQEPNFGRKMVAVAGDVSEIRLGISVKEWDTLTKEVEVIFHEAATTRFNESLRVATLINVRGTRECLRLGKDCKKLCSYVHVSTAYTHCTFEMVGGEVEEAFYRSPMPPDAMISIAETMEEDRLVQITSNLIKDWPNTYTFTKALSEELIRTTSDGLPICVVRPGIVISAANEPNPSWIDSTVIYSANGLIFLIVLGIMKPVLVDVHKSLALIPCDYVTNAAIAAGFEASVTQTRGGSDTKIYAVTTTSRNPINWQACAAFMRRNRYKAPSPNAVYYAETIETKSPVVFALLTMYWLLIPAVIADLVRLLMGKERLYVKLVKKIYDISKTISYFLVNDWKILDQNTEKLYAGLSEEDKVIFNFDITDIRWNDFIKIWLIGIRKYFIKDGLKDTNYGVKKQKILCLVHYGVVIPLYTYLLWKMFYLFATVSFGLVIGIFN